MIRSAVAWWVFGLSLLAPALAATAEDLGGIAYVRMRSLAEAAPAVTKPTLFDLRYVDAADGLGPIADQLRAAGPLRIVIHDAAPPPALAALLQDLPARVLTVAPADAEPPADFEVEIDPADDRAAFEVREAGTALTALIRTETEKERHDEAALVRQRNRRAAGPAAGAAATPENTAPPIDRVLQRAWHLARGLQALGLAD